MRGRTAGCATSSGRNTADASARAATAVIQHLPWVETWSRLEQGYVRNSCVSGGCNASRHTFLVAAQTRPPHSRGNETQQENMKRNKNTGLGVPFLYIALLTLDYLRLGSLLATMSGSGGRSANNSSLDNLTRRLMVCLFVFKHNNRNEPIRNALAQSEPKQSRNEAVRTEPNREHNQTETKTTKRRPRDSPSSADVYTIISRRVARTTDPRSSSLFFLHPGNDNNNIGSQKKKKHKKLLANP